MDDETPHYVKWEYETLRGKQVPEHFEQQWLNKRGRDGWELVWRAGEGDVCSYYFKRPLHSAERARYPQPDPGASRRSLERFLRDRITVRLKTTDGKTMIVDAHWNDNTWEATVERSALAALAGDPPPDPGKTA